MLTMFQCHLETLPDELPIGVLNASEYVLEDTPQQGSSPLVQENIPDESPLRRTSSSPGKTHLSYLYLTPLEWYEQNLGGSHTFYDPNLVREM